MYSFHLIIITFLVEFGNETRFVSHTHPFSTEYNNGFYWFIQGLLYKHHKYQTTYSAMMTMIQTSTR